MVLPDIRHVDVGSLGDCGVDDALRRRVRDFLAEEYGARTQAHDLAYAHHEASHVATAWLLLGPANVQKVSLRPWAWEAQARSWIVTQPHWEETLAIVLAGCVGEAAHAGKDVIDMPDGDRRMFDDCCGYQALDPSTAEFYLRPLLAQMFKEPAVRRAVDGLARRLVGHLTLKGGHLEELRLRFEPGLVRIRDEYVDRCCRLLKMAKVVH